MSTKPRVLLYSGKGGVGKTTIAAASSVALAKRGYRTLIISFDLAHSLRDVFDLDQDLFQQNEGAPQKVSDNLEVQEVNIQSEIQRHWGALHNYFALLFNSAESSKLLADELTFIPGVENIVCLLYINRYVEEGTYDAIVVDCPPTADSIRFVSLPRAIEWYLEKRYKVDRMATKIARPILQMSTNYGVLPDDSMFETLKEMLSKVQGIESVLADPKMTSVRLVTNAEKLIVKETQRAFLYFSLYSVNTDCVIINRLFPKSRGYFAEWAKSQFAHSQEIENYFSPVPVIKVPLFASEVSGVARLEEVAEVLFADRDPGANYTEAPPFGFEKVDDKYRMELSLPFADNAEVDLIPRETDLVISVGSFERFVPLPRAVVGLNVESAILKDGKLVATFGSGQSITERS